MKKKHIILGLTGLILVLTTGLVLAEKPNTKTLNRAVVKIDSLSCGGCFSTINDGLAPLEGYSGMGANLFRKLIAIDFTAPLTAEEISQTLSKVGYPGKLQSVDAISEKESFAYIDSKRSGSAYGGGACCSVTPPPVSNKKNENQPKTILPQTKGSCCTLPVPGVSQPTKDL